MYEKCTKNARKPERYYNDICVNLEYNSEDTAIYMQE